MRGKKEIKKRKHRSTTGREMRISFIEEMSGGIFYVGSMQYLFFSGAEV
jgi:hypothetical protein